MTRQLGRYRTLLHLAVDPEQREQLSALISLVGIPPDLCYWFDGLRRTKYILRADQVEFDQLLGMVGSAKTTADWLDWIELGDRLSPSLIEPQDDPMSLTMGRVKTGDNHPLNHYCLSICPHWSALFYEMDPGATSKQQQAYKALQAKVSRYILAAQALTRDATFVDRYAGWRGICAEVTRLKGDQPVGRIQAASRSLRRLAHTSFGRHIELFDSGEKTLVDLCDAVDEQLAEQEAPTTTAEKDTHQELRIILGDLRRLGELVCGTAKARTKGPLGPRGVTRHDWPDGYIRITGDRLALGVEELDDGVKFSRVYEYSRLGKPSRSHWNEPGPPAFDPADQIGISILEYVGDTPDREGPRRLQSERQAALLARLSTVHTLGRTDLSLWQIDRIFSKLGETEPELRGYLIASLATGRDLAERGLPILTKTPKKPPEIAFLLEAQPSWLIRIDPPAFADAELADAERPTSRLIQLPDLRGFAACLKRPPESSFAAAGGEAESERFAACLKRPLQRSVTWGPEIRPKALDWLRRTLWDPSPSLRVLHGFLLRRLLDEANGDLGLIHLLIGTTLSHSNSAAHYTARSVSTVVEHYRRALGPLQEGNPASSNSTPLAIGARRVPTFDSIFNLVKALASQVDASSGAAYRNALTAYTLVAFNVGTAGRAFETRRLQDVIRAYGLVVLAEKGAPYNQRVVPLAPALDAQLVAYLNVLAGWGYPSDGPHGLFCWWDGGTQPAGPFTPERFSTLAKEWCFDLDLYALRRFARSELLERGASPEDIDALMGHWLHLLSPHDRLSTYPPRRLRALADGVIETLLQDLGFKALP